MRRLSVAALSAGLSLCALGGSYAFVWFWGVSLSALAAGFGCWLVAAVLMMVLGARMDGRMSVGLNTIGSAVACPPPEQGGELAYVQAIVASLCLRLERASSFKMAFSEMALPAAVCTVDGDVLLSSAGLLALDGQMVPGFNVKGSGQLNLGGVDLAPTGSADQTRVTSRIGDVSYAAVSRSVSAERVVISFVRQGIVIPERAFDEFADAIMSGQTGFRFDDAALRETPALKRINQGFGALDESLVLMTRALEGDERSFERARGLNSGFATQVRAVCEIVASLAEQIGDEEHLRAGLEHKLVQIEQLIDRHRAVSARIGGFAQSAVNDASDLRVSLTTGSTRVREAAEVGRVARSLAHEAGLVAQRTTASSAGVEAITGEIEKMVAAIEDVSFRTNLLALNAAVEAARAGEHGKSFAVVADEVRMLAQTAGKTSREIRNLVGRGREESGVGSSQAVALEQMIAELDGYLLNLSNGTDMIATALDDGVGALTRLDGDIARISEGSSRADDADNAAKGRRRSA